MRKVELLPHYRVIVSRRARAQFLFKNVVVVIPEGIRRYGKGDK
jgi:hypothetical protein